MAGLADPVAAGLEPLERLLDLGELALDLLEQGLVLLVLEDLGADVGRVLVVVGLLADAGRVRGGRRVGLQTAEHPLQAGTLLLEAGAGLLLFHQPLPC